MAEMNESKWDKKLAKAERFLQKAHEHGEKVYRKYVDAREQSALGNRQVNFFYANTNTLRGSLFNSLPKPEVSRIQKGDFQDDVARVAALITQRALTYEVHCAKAFEESIKMAILDRLVPGIGQVWVNFHGSSLSLDHVKWDEFLYDPQRVWSKVRWVARKRKFSHAEMKEKYNKNVDFLSDDSDCGAGIVTMNKQDSDLNPKELDEGTYCVYEVWDKDTKKIYHIYRGQPEPLLVMDDELKLRDFFPCPPPLIANANGNSLLPITDYHLAQDQYRQLDTLYARISLIIQAIKAAGIYNAAEPAIGRMLSSSDNEMIPVEDWAMMAEKGGVANQIGWYPVEKVGAVLQMLYNSFEGTKAILYEITGMSDILRGASSPYETKGAQEIKAQFASVRMNEYQKEVAEFVRDTLRIMAEMVTQLYSEEQLAKIVGDLSESDRPYAPNAFQVLRNDILAKYKVDVQANSLTQADWALEKDQKIEVVQTIGQMIAQIAEITAKSPQLTVLGVQLVKFAISGYKSAVELEGWIDGELDKLMRAQVEAEQNPQPEQPSPEEIKAQTEQQKAQMEMQVRDKEAQYKAQEAQMKMAMEQQKLSFERQMFEQKIAFEREMAQIKIMLQQALAGAKLQEAQMGMQVKQQEAAVGMQVKQQEAAMGLEQKEQQFEQQARFAEQAEARKSESESEGQEDE